MTYDRSVRMFDEGYSPEDLEKKLANQELGKGAFLDDFFSASYLMQMKMIWEVHPEKLLEIGPGEGFVKSYLQYMGINYDTLDIKGDPTYQCTLEEFDPGALDLQSSYEMVCCFQMLEHSPYENFIENIKKLSCLSKKYVFISLPYDCHGFWLRFKWHIAQRKSKDFKWSLFWPRSKPNRKYREEYMREFPWAVHYWELGRKGYPVSRIRNDLLATGLVVKKEFLSDNPFHYFFLLEKK